jgi:hypothetical protein
MGESDTPTIQPQEPINNEEQKFLIAPDSVEVKGRKP